jgi:hypothetical protein
MENIENIPKKESEEIDIDKFLKLISDKSIENISPHDYEADFLRAISELYQKFPLSDVSPELRKVVFYGLQNKIELVLESSKLLDEFKSRTEDSTVAKFDTFKLQRDVVINRINNISNILKTFEDSNLKKEWEEEYKKKCDDFEKGLLEGKNIDTNDPEKKFYEIANWAKKTFGDGRFLYTVNPELLGKSSNIIPQLFLDAIKYLSQIALEQLKNFEGKPEDIKNRWFDEKGRELFRGVAAFLAAESVLRRKRHQPALT